MKPSHVLLVAGGLVALPAASSGQQGLEVDPGLRIEEREQHYVVDAESFRELAEILNDTRLEGEDRPPAQGLTAYDLRPHWRYSPVGDGCAVTEATIDLSITITLPSWPQAQTASEDDRTLWHGVRDAITRHEYTHRDITVEEAQILLDKLRAVRAATCTGLGRAVDGILAIAEAALSRRHGDFDLKDGHRVIGGN